jgi:tRNA dimethylallyltransferase
VSFHTKSNIQALKPHPLIAIVGPTASGKSELALWLAARFGGEIINYDSVQVFRRLDIGSAKPSPEHRRLAPHHMIDVREPTEVFTAGDYQREARTILDDVKQRKRLPILVGGTGLYLRALTEGLFDGPSRSVYWRNRLETISERKGREYLYALLKRLDAVAAARIAPRDKPKIIRALEVRLETGKPLSEHLARQPRRPLEGFDLMTIGLDPPREEVHRRINERVCRMFDSGLVEEVRGLLSEGIPRSAKPLGAIGYRHVLANLDACNGWQDTIRIIQRDTRQYAKRQMTWFRKQSHVTWFDGPGDNDQIKEQVYRSIQLVLP